MQRNDMLREAQRDARIICLIKIFFRNTQRPLPAEFGRPHGIADVAAFDDKSFHGLNCFLRRLRRHNRPRLYTNQNKYRKLLKAHAYTTVYTPTSHLARYARYAPRSTQPSIPLK